MEFRGGLHRHDDGCCVLWLERRVSLSVTTKPGQLNLPEWVSDLPAEDLEFVRRFVLSSGSLKALAQEYRVSYPTIRQRLDRLIARIRVTETLHDADPLTRRIRGFVADGRLDPTAGKALLETYTRLKTQGGS